MEKLDLITPEELAKELRVPLSRVYQETRKRGPDAIPCVRIGKYCRFSLPAVMQWLERRQTGNWLGNRAERA